AAGPRPPPSGLGGSPGSPCPQRLPRTGSSSVMSLSYWRLVRPIELEPITFGSGVGRSTPSKPFFSGCFRRQIVGNTWKEGASLLHGVAPGFGVVHVWWNQNGTTARSGRVQ